MYPRNCEDCAADITLETELKIDDPEMLNVIYCPGCFRIYGHITDTYPLGIDLGNSGLLIYYDKNRHDDVLGRFVLTIRGTFKPSLKYN